MRSGGRMWCGWVCWLLFWPGVLFAASPYASVSGAGLFPVEDQTVTVWGDSDGDGIPDPLDTRHNVGVTVIQGPDQDWSGTAQIRPGLIHYDNFLGPRDTCTSGWGGAASGGSLIVGFDQDFVDGGGETVYVDYKGVGHPLAPGADFIVEGFGFCFNRAFSDERGTVNIYVADAAYNPVIGDTDPVTGLRSITGDETRWVKISGWLGRQSDGTWVGNPNHNFASAPGAYGLYLWGDLADAGLTAARYIKFELGDGGHYIDPYSGIQNTGRALFIDAVKTLYHPPIARAGDDRQVSAGSPVALDGTDSEDADGDELTFQWRQTTGPEIVLAGAASATPSFTPVQGGNYTFLLTADDGTFQGTDSVTVTVVGAGINQSPRAVAPADLDCNVGDTVVLDGSASTDPDGDELAFSWEQISGPPVVLAAATTATASFTAPNIPLAPVFRLTVADPEGLADTDTVSVHINRPPIVDVTRTLDTATESLLFTLDASRSWDPDLDTLAYEWVQLSGPAVVLSNPLAARPTFMVPEAAGEEMGFKVTVSDGKGFALEETVTVIIRELFIIDTDNPATSAWQVGSFSLRTEKLDLARGALAFPDMTGDGGGDASGFPEGRGGNLTLRFNIPVADGDGDDLTIYHLGTGETRVLASIDGENWVGLSPLDPADSGTVQLQRYDFKDFPGLSLSRVISVQYLKIVKDPGPGARFIDGVVGHHTALTAIYAAYMEHAGGSVDWSEKKSDGGVHALGRPDYDTAAPGIGNCSGWMVNSGYMIAGFDNPFTDRDGPDLFIHHFGQGVTDADLALGAEKGATTVEVSEDGNYWVLLGDLPPGKNGGNHLRVDAFDFNAYPALGALEAEGRYREARIRFVRINKNGKGYGAGKFIDAIEGRFGFPGMGDPAGGDIAVDEGVGVVLGRKNAALDDFDETVYIWEQLDNGGPMVALSSASVKNPTFVTPAVTGAQATLAFKLTRINENEFGASVSTVTVAVGENGITGFPAAATTFLNPVAGKHMGLHSRHGSLVYYRASDPDYKFSEGFIAEMRDRPKNLNFGMLDLTLILDSGGAAAIDLLLPAAPSPEYRWYRYATGTGWQACMRGAMPAASEDGAQFNADGKTTTLNVTDNGPLDDDDTEGVVRTRVGLGIPGGWHDDADGGGGGGCFVNTLYK